MIFHPRPERGKEFSQGVGQWGKNLLGKGNNLGKPQEKGKKEHDNQLVVKLIIIVGAKIWSEEAKKKKVAEGPYYKPHWARLVFPQVRSGFTSIESLGDFQQGALFTFTFT